MFIDETWTKTNMAPLRGWAPRGQRIKAKVPHRRWKTMTFMAALRHDRIAAPWFLDGPINGEPSSTSSRFSSRPCDPATSSSWITSAPTRATPSVRPSGPPAPSCSSCPNTRHLNPIEQLFAKLKHCLRKAAQRTTEAVYQAIGPILNTLYWPSAPTTSQTLDMTKLEPIPL